MALHRVTITEALVQELIKAIHEPVTIERLWQLRNETVLSRHANDARLLQLEITLLTNVQATLKTVLMQMDGGADIPDGD